MARVSTLEPLPAEVRRARVRDVAGIQALVDTYVPDRRLLSKAPVTLYEDVQEFFVAVDGERVVGCGALHVLWEDLAEVRTLAVAPHVHGRGIGAGLLARLMEQAGELGVSRLFCLTFETGFFARHGFVPLDEVLLAPEVQAELLRSADEGVAEFLELERVKPNTLGNTRMLALLPGMLLPGNIARPPSAVTG
ncbi:MAG: amino-acid N-acetyltransferase [Mycobacteriales bacterium]